MLNAQCGAIAHYYYHYQPQQAQQQQHDHYLHHYEHEQHQHDHQHHEHSPSPTTHFYEFGEVKEFRDPWEDYYENLARERSNSIKNNEQQQQQEWQQHAPSEPESAPAPAPEWHGGEVEQSSSEMRSRHWSQEQNEANNNREQTCQEQQDYHYEEQEQQKEQYHDYGSHESHKHHEESQEQSTNLSTSDLNANENAEATATTKNQTIIYEADIHNENTAQKQQDFSPVTQPMHTDDTTTNTISARCSTDKQAFRSEEVNEKENKNNNNEAGLAGALSQLRLGEQRTPEQEAYEQLMRRQCWEAGQVDYAGQDSFDNIWKKITKTLESKPSASLPQEEDKSGTS